MAIPVSPNNMRNQQIRRAIADSVSVTVEQFMLEFEKKNQRLANVHGALAVSNAGSVQ